MKKYNMLLILGIVMMTSCSSGQTKGPVATINSAASIAKPYVILISLDGFRWDYVDRYNPPHLSHFIKTGVKAESLIPSFPTKTFPNHYTIATGMYPNKHGIVANTFYSHDKKSLYKISDREKVEDGSFYRGTPIWVLADKSGMVSASYFFVGSEASVQGIRPTYYYRYDGSVPNEKRVAQVIDWLGKPEKERPHIITMYFSDMDDIGHRFGPENDEELRETLYDLDNTLGSLFDGVAKSGLPVNIIIVSDHGMAAVPTSNFLPIEPIKNNLLFTTADNGALVSLHVKNPTQVDSIYSYLKAKENKFKVYKTEDTPAFEYKPTNEDWGDIQIIPDSGFYFSSTSRIERMKKNGIIISGEHGYDPKYKDMHGIFYANGPAFKKEYVIPATKNINVYPLVCYLLGLDPPSDIDGDLKAIQSVLKER